MTALAALAWPGNVRQLENAVYRAVVMSESDELGPADFPQAAAPPHIQGTHEQLGEPSTLMHPFHHAAAPSIISGNDIPIVPLPAAVGSLSMLGSDDEVRPLEAMETEIIRFAISHYRGQMSEVARRLKIGRSTLYRKLDETAANEQGHASDELK